MLIKQETVVIDTNVLLESPQVVKEYQRVILPIHIIEELDGLKKAVGELGFKARRAIKQLELADNILWNAKDNYQLCFDSWDESKRDNQIIYCAATYGAKLISNDLAVRIKARALNITTEPYVKASSYKGVKQFAGNTKFINDFFQALSEQPEASPFLTNEYVILTNNDLNQTYEYRWDGNQLVRLKLPKEVPGLNALQRCALDLMNNQDLTIKLILGGYGSGKTYLSVQVALQHLRTGSYSKILCVREPVGEGKEIGFLKGSKEEKTDDFFKPIEHSLKGGEFELLDMIKRGQLEKEVPYFMKGTTYNDTIILCDEAEDIHYKQLKLIGTRLGTGSCIYLIGDYKQSILDMTENNGLLRLVEQLKGNPKVGIITLDEDVRSETSKIFADLE